jgi:hypothetical protein
MSLGFIRMSKSQHDFRTSSRRWIVVQYQCVRTKLGFSQQDRTMLDAGSRCRGCCGWLTGDGMDCVQTTMNICQRIVQRNASQSLHLLHWSAYRVYISDCIDITAPSLIERPASPVRCRCTLHFRPSSPRPPLSTRHSLLGSPKAWSRPGRTRDQQ